MAQSIAQLLQTLNGEYHAGRLLQVKTSVALTDLSRLLDEISNFVQKEVSSSFLKLLFSKNQRVARIDNYHRRISTSIKSFQRQQVSALLNIREWQTRNDDARAADQRALNELLCRLETNHQRLKDALNTPGSSVMAMIVSLQRRLDHRSDGDREQQFFSHVLRYLTTSSGLRVELQSWMITSYEVELGPKIGSGGFGQVFLGTWNNAQVALKVLETEAGIAPSSTAIRQQIETWSMLRHTHILQFLGGNEFDDKPFVVMPYMQNGNARDYVRNHPDCDRLRIFHHISLGLVYLHSHKIVHGDLKALNVLIDSSGKAVLCDFGLSRIKADATSRTVVKTDGGIAGSRNWMAPELLLGGSLKMPCDIYAFGMTIYEIFANDIPLGHINAADFIELVVRRDVRPERPDDADAPQLSDAVWKLAERCWLKDLKQRPTASDVCGTISHLLNAPTITPPKPVSPPSHPTLTQPMLQLPDANESEDYGMGEENDADWETREKARQRAIPAIVEQNEAEPEQNAAVPAPHIRVPEPATDATADIVDSSMDDVDRSIEHQVRSLYPYEGQCPEDLTFRENLILLANPSKTGGDWWYGTVVRDGKSGFFPKPYVETLEITKATAIYSYTGGNADELPFTEGDELSIVDKSDADWWKAEQGGVIFMVPAAYLEVVEDLPPIPGNPTDNSPRLDDAFDRYESFRNTQGNSNRFSVASSFKTGPPSPGGSPVVLLTPNISKDDESRLKSHLLNFFLGRRIPANDDPQKRALTISGPIINHNASPSRSSWASLVDKAVIQGLPKEECRRQEAIFELITTEADYVRDLQLIVEVFYSSMLPLLDTKAITVIFANVEDILINNTTFLSALEERQKECRLYIDQIGDILRNNMSNMAIYMTYCVNQGVAIKVLQSLRDKYPQLASHLQRLRNDPAVRNLDLSSYLLVPMQRMTKYPLLIRQILQYTDTAHDRGEIEQALNTAETFFNNINEMIREQEGHERLKTISQHLWIGKGSRLDLTAPTRYMGQRQLLKEGVLFKAKGGRKLHSILCSDIIVLTDDKVKNLYRMPIPLAGLQVKETGGGRDNPTFQIAETQGGNAVPLESFRATSVRDCQMWMQMIDNASRRCREAEKQAAPRGMHL